MKNFTFYKSKFRKKTKMFFLFLFFTYIAETNLRIFSFAANKNNLSINYLKSNHGKDYILGPGDTIEVRLIDNQSEKFSLPKNYKTVKGDGTIFLKRLGNIYIEGLTISELTKLLEERYIEFLKIPKIELKIINYRPIKVYIEGEVQNPGLYTLKGSYKESDIEVKGNKNVQDPTNTGFSSEFSNSFFFPAIYDLIRTAGGINIYSDLTNVDVIRINNISDGGGKIKANVNLLDMIENGFSQNNIRIFDGDYIKISKNSNPSLGQISKAMKSNLNPKFITIKVSGDVEQAGVHKLTKTSTLNDAILYSGGVKFSSGMVNFFRVNSDGILEKRRINYSARNPSGSYKNPYLQSGDMIFVSKGKLKKLNEIIIETTTPIINIYGMYKIFSD